MSDENIMDKVRQAMARAILAEPECDPNNPWPLGSNWYHKHNEIWKRNQRRRSRP